MEGMGQDVSTVAGESTDLIIMEEISTLSREPELASNNEPLRIPPIMSTHVNNSPSISLCSFSNRGRNARRFFPRTTSKFGSCDSNSYCLSCMSVIFVALGAFITVTTLGGTKFSLGHMWSVGPIFFCVGIMMAMKCYVYLRSKREIEMLFIAEIVCQQMMRLEDEGRRRLVERSQHLFNSHGITREIFTLVSDQVLSDRYPQRDARGEQVRQHSHVVSATVSIPSPMHRATLMTDSPPPHSINMASINASPVSIRNMPPAYDSIAKPDPEAPPPTYSEAIALMAQHKIINETNQNTE